MRLTHTICYILFVLCLAQARAASGGPDAYGYTFRDEGESGAPLNTWIDIESPENRVIDGGENSGGQFVRLGQPITFYGQTYFLFFVSVEGYLSFNARDGGFDDSPDCPLPTAPSSGSGDRIYAMHRNWETASGVYYKYFKQSPHDWSDCGVSVFSWNVYPEGSPGIFRSFQVLLFDSGDILVQEGQILSNSFGDDETIGLQKGDLSAGLAYGCPNPILNTSTKAAILFELIGTGATVPDGAKLIFDQSPDGSIAPPSTIVIDQPVTYVGTATSSQSNGSFRSGRVFNGAEVIIDGVTVNIFDAYFINSPGVAVSVINGGHLNLCNVSILGAAEHAIVVGKDSKLTMRQSVISNSVPDSESYIIMEEDTEAYIYKSLISESRSNGIEMIGERTDPAVLELEKSSLIRNRNNAIEATNSNVFIIQSTIADNLGAAVYGTASNLDASSSTITGNLSGGLIMAPGSLRLDHSVVAGNFSSITGELLNFSATTVTSDGSNVADTTETFLNAPGDQNKADPLLTPPGGYGEPVGAAAPPPDRSVDYTNPATK